MEKQAQLDAKTAEQSLSGIGAKIADANDLTEEIVQLSKKQEEKLITAQEEISDLYEELEEIEELKEPAATENNGAKPS